VGARTGGRSERVVHDVLEATIDELARVGYAALRMDDVAARAGVAKTTVYRRWPTKAELVDAAVREAARIDDPIPDTGSLRSDLVELLQVNVGRMALPKARALARLVANEGGDPEVDRLARKVRDEKRASHARVLERAKQRGELPAEVDSGLVVEVLFAPLVARTLRYGQKPTAEEIARIVDLVLAGAENGGGITGRPTRRPARRA
jgi:AcrR family transcriptional regulator